MLICITYTFRNLFEKEKYYHSKFPHFCHFSVGKKLNAYKLKKFFFMAVSKIQTDALPKVQKMIVEYNNIWQGAYDATTPSSKGKPKKCVIVTTRRGVYVFRPKLFSVSYKLKYMFFILEFNEIEYIDEKTRRFHIKGYHPIDFTCEWCNLLVRDILKSCIQYCYGSSLPHVIYTSNFPPGTVPKPDKLHRMDKLTMFRYKQYLFAKNLSKDISALRALEIFENTNMTTFYIDFIAQQPCDPRALSYAIAHEGTINTICCNNFAPQNVCVFLKQVMKISRTVRCLQFIDYDDLYFEAGRFGKIKNALVNQITLIHCFKNPVRLIQFLLEFKFYRYDIQRLEITNCRMNMKCAKEFAKILLGFHCFRALEILIVRGLETDPSEKSAVYSCIYQAVNRMPSLCQVCIEYWQPKIQVSPDTFNLNLPYLTFLSLGNCNLSDIPEPEFPKNIKRFSFSGSTFTLRTFTSVMDKINQHPINFSLDLSQLDMTLKDWLTFFEKNKSKAISGNLTEFSWAGNPVNSQIIPGLSAYFLKSPNLQYLDISKCFSPKSQTVLDEFFLQIYGTPLWGIKIDADDNTAFGPILIQRILKIPTLVSVTLVGHNMTTKDLKELTKLPRLGEVVVDNFKVENREEIYDLYLNTFLQKESIFALFPPIQCILKTKNKSVQTLLDFRAKIDKKLFPGDDIVRAEYYSENGSDMMGYKRFLQSFPLSRRKTVPRDTFSMIEFTPHVMYESSMHDPTVQKVANHFVDSQMNHLEDIWKAPKSAPQEKFEPPSWIQQIAQEKKIKKRTVGIPVPAPPLDLQEEETTDAPLTVALSVIPMSEMITSTEDHSEPAPSNLVNPEDLGVIVINNSPQKEENTPVVENNKEHIESNTTSSDVNNKKSSSSSDSSSDDEKTPEPQPEQENQTSPGKKGKGKKGKKKRDGKKGAKQDTKEVKINTPPEDQNQEAEKNNQHKEQKLIRVSSISNVLPLDAFIPEEDNKDAINNANESPIAPDSSTQESHTESTTKDSSSKHEPMIILSGEENQIPPEKLTQEPNLDEVRERMSSITNDDEANQEQQTTSNYIPSILLPDAIEPLPATGESNKQQHDAEDKKDEEKSESSSSSSSSSSSNVEMPQTNEIPPPLPVPPIPVPVPIPDEEKSESSSSSSSSKKDKDSDVMPPAIPVPMQVPPQQAVPSQPTIPSPLDAPQEKTKPQEPVIPLPPIIPTTEREVNQPNKDEHKDEEDYEEEDYEEEEEEEEEHESEVPQMQPPPATPPKSPYLIKPDPPQPFSPTAQETKEEEEKAEEEQGEQKSLEPTESSNVVIMGGLFTRAIPISRFGRQFSESDSEGGHGPPDEIDAINPHVKSNKPQRLLVPQVGGVYNRIMMQQNQSFNSSSESDEDIGPVLAMKKDRELQEAPTSPLPSPPVSPKRQTATKSLGNIDQSIKLPAAAEESTTATQEDSPEKPVPHVKPPSFTLAKKQSPQPSPKKRVTPSGFILLDDKESSSSESSEPPLLMIKPDQIKSQNQRTPPRRVSGRRYGLKSPTQPQQNQQQSEKPQQKEETPETKKEENPVNNSENQQKNKEEPIKNNENEQKSEKKEETPINNKASSSSSESSSSESEEESEEERHSRHRHHRHRGDGSSRSSRRNNYDEDESPRHRHSRRRHRHHHDSSDSGEDDSYSPRTPRSRRRRHRDDSFDDNQENRSHRSRRSRNYDEDNSYSPKRPKRGITNESIDNASKHSRSSKLPVPPISMSSSNELPNIQEEPEQPLPNEVIINKSEGVEFVTVSQIEPGEEVYQLVSDTTGKKTSAVTDLSEVQANWITAPPLQTTSVVEKQESSSSSSDEEKTDDIHETTDDGRSPNNKFSEQTSNVIPESSVLSKFNESSMREQINNSNDASDSSDKDRSSPPMSNVAHAEPADMTDEQLVNDIKKPERRRRHRSRRDDSSSVEIPEDLVDEPINNGRRKPDRKRRSRNNDSKSMAPSRNRDLLIDDPLFDEAMTAVSESFFASPKKKPSVLSVLPIPDAPSSDSEQIPELEEFSTPKPEEPIPTPPESTPTTIKCRPSYTIARVHGFNIPLPKMNVKTRESSSRRQRKR